MKHYFASAFLFLAMAAVLPLWGQEHYLPKHYKLKLDEKGNIPPKFWNYELPPVKAVTQSGTVINLPVKLMKQGLIDLDPEDTDPQSPEYKKGKKLVDRVLKVLLRAGVTVGDKERFPLTEEKYVAAFGVQQIENSGIYLWQVADQSFLVNPSNHSQVVFLKVSDNSGDNWHKSVQEARVKLLGPGIYRVACNLSALANGCEASTVQWLSIFDVDFKEGNLVRWDFPNISFWTDLNQDGSFEVVRMQGVDDDVFFPWVYTWDGEKWADRRAKFWNFYQTGKLNAWGICGDGRQSKLPDAFDEAIQDGTPLKFWQAREGTEK